MDSNTNARMSEAPKGAPKAGQERNPTMRGYAPLTASFILAVERGSIRIIRAYSGKTRTCACGCAGTYYEPGTPNGDRQIARITALLLQHAEAQVSTEPFGSEQHAFVTIGQRDYTVYFSADEYQAAVAK